MKGDSMKATYSEIALRDIARIEAENKHSPDYIKFAGIAGALTAQLRHVASQADQEAARNQRILGSLSEYERACSVRAIEADEVHDHCDFLLAGLEQMYDDSPDPEGALDEVTGLIERLKTALTQLAKVDAVDATDVLTAHQDSAYEQRRAA
jgi:hypothetical protein